MASIPATLRRVDPSQFAAKWHGSTLNERQASQAHFSDLCRMLGWPTSTDDDTTGERFVFEKGAAKVGGGDGFASGARTASPGSTRVSARTSTLPIASCWKQTQILSGVNKKSR